MGREAVDLLAHGLQRLTRHDVHIPGEEHAARSTLTHRANKGVLDLGERATIRNGILVLDDLGSLDEEEAVIAGVGSLRQNDAPFPIVSLLHGKEARAILVSTGTAVVATTVTILLLRVNLLRLVGGDAEPAEHICVEVLATHEHSHGAGVESLAKIVKHDRHHDVSHAHATGGLRIDASDLSQHLVVDGEG